MEGSRATSLAREQNNEVAQKEHLLGASIYLDTSDDSNEIEGHLCLDIAMLTSRRPTVCERCAGGVPLQCLKYLLPHIAFYTENKYSKVAQAYSQGSCTLTSPSRVPGRIRIPTPSSVCAKLTKAGFETALPATLWSNEVLRILVPHVRTYALR